MGYPPSATPIPDPARILVIAAHPDDIDFGAAGTIAQWTASGIDVTYCLVTRGETGGFDDTPRDEMPRIREAEQRAAAAEVGVHELRFLDGYADGAVYVTHELRRDLSKVIREVRPDRVVMMSPLRVWDRLGPGHPDHLAVGEATMCAVYPDARNPHAHPELLADHGLEAWTVKEVWIMAGPDPDYFVDITDTVDRKIAALAAHRSQTAHLPDLAAMVRGWLRDNARRAGFPEGRLAEAFTVVRTH